ncbi:MAG: metallophosphoesterase [Planctomycetota bacterium]|jgi:predicted MPP superfamily phosphohydrolase
MLLKRNRKPRGSGALKDSVGYMITREKLVVIIFLTSVAIIYSLEIFFISVFSFNKLRGRSNTKVLLRKPAVFVHFLAIFGILCLLYGLFIEPYWIEVKTVQIQTEKLSNTTLRVVQISDLHCDKKPRNEKKLVKLISVLRPDIIAFTGDTLGPGAPSALPLFKDTMKKLNATLAKFAVRGNIDVWHLPNLDLFSGTGFEVLDAKTAKLEINGETFYISGLSCRYPAAPRGLLHDIPDNRFSVFLRHYPDLIEDLKDLNVDLYLAGHTHGGQIALPFYGALTTLSKYGKKYEAGMYTVDTKILYVNRGIGGHTWNVRFLARPEITVFDIGPKKAAAK